MCVLHISALKNVVSFCCWLAFCACFMRVFAIVLYVWLHGSCTFTLFLCCLSVLHFHEVPQHFHVHQVPEQFSIGTGDTVRSWNMPEEASVPVESEASVPVESEASVPVASGEFVESRAKK